MFVTILTAVEKDVQILMKVNFVQKERLTQ